jgi:hypothetical protein
MSEAKEVLRKSFYAFGQMIIFRKSSIHCCYCISDFAKCSRPKRLKLYGFRDQFAWLRAVLYVVNDYLLTVFNLKFFKACNLSLPLSQYKHRLSITKTSWLLLLTQIIAVIYENWPTETNSPQHVKYHMLNLTFRGPRSLSIFPVAQWLRCCATNRKVAGSIPDCVIGIFLLT